jgi:hypothetical protein
MNELTYKIYSLSPSSEQLFAEGTKTYTIDDIIIHERKNSRPHEDSPFPVWWSKALSIAEGFFIGASIYRNTKRVGFGLWLTRSERRDKDAGFSWEWFQYQQGDIFKKLQGAGTIKATFLKNGAHEEIVSIDFLEDVILRYKDEVGKPGKTHHVYIQRGSIFQVAPQQD